MQLKNIAEWTEGKLFSDPSLKVKKVIIDSRKAGPGSLFFCLKGKKYDGHDFVSEVKKAGGYSIGEKEDCDILVDSSLGALVEAARRRRIESQTKIIGITGSSGKTTTVSMTASILGRRYVTCRTPKSFNTLTGVSQSILNFSPNCSFAAVEIGANHSGEIKEICSVARPSVGVITNIGDAHIGYFGSKKSLADAKFELADSLPPEGCLIYNYDQKEVRDRAKSYEIFKIGFGLKEGADIKGKVLNISSAGSLFEWEGQKIRLKAQGRFNVMNALGAIAAASFFKVEKKKIVNGLEEFKLPLHRINVIKKGKIEIIDDCYNASPASVKTLFKELLKIYPQKDIIAVLGQMRELGDMAENLHSETGSFLAGLKKIKYILSSGKYSGNLFEGAQRAGFEKKNLFKFSQPSEASEIIKRLAGRNSLVVLKASRLESFEKILNELTR